MPNPTILRSAAIRCVADEHGSSEFIIEHEKRTFCVIAHSREEADVAVRSYLTTTIPDGITQDNYGPELEPHTNQSLIHHSPHPASQQPAAQPYTSPDSRCSSTGAAPSIAPPVTASPHESACHFS